MAQTMTDAGAAEAPPTTVREVVDRLHDAANGEATSVDDVVETLGHASFVPVLMAPALAVVTPLSGIPLFSSVCGVFIALVAGQLLLGRRHLWLPSWLRSRAMPSGRLRKIADGLRGPADWIDRRSGKRLSFLVSPPFDRLVHLACVACGAVMPFLELFPFTSSILAAAVVLMSLTLLVKDGLFALIGLSTIGAAIGVALQLAL